MVYKFRCRFESLTKLNLADIQNYGHSVLMLDKLLINGNSLILNGSNSFRGGGGGEWGRQMRGIVQVSVRHSRSLFQRKIWYSILLLRTQKVKRWSSLSYVSQYLLDLQTRDRRRAHFTPTPPPPPPSAFRSSFHQCSVLRVTSMWGYDWKSPELGIYRTKDGALTGCANPLSSLQEDEFDTIF